jgi:hypothetical protein
VKSRLHISTISSYVAIQVLSDDQWLEVVRFCVGTEYYFTELATALDAARQYQITLDTIESE